MSIRIAPRTPYEIRLELLQLAQLILSNKHASGCVKNGGNIITSPTTEEILLEAEKMNIFISKGIQSH